jgi:enamine deaminase RidA (YjgF/YER057c/UK114 family)
LSESAALKPPVSTGHTRLLPEGWPKPRGYSNGIRASGEFVFVGGVIGWDEKEQFPEGGFIPQARQLFKNILAVLKEGGATPADMVRMTWYVVDIEEYLSSLSELGKAYREVLGSNYPAMALVQVVRLAEPKARLEIETTAVLPAK